MCNDKTLPEAKTGLYIWLDVIPFWAYVGSCSSNAHVMIFSSVFSHRVDVYHLFHVLHVLYVLNVLPTYSMFSHLGWQDGTTCRALTLGMMVRMMMEMMFVKKTTDVSIPRGSRQHQQSARIIISSNIGPVALIILYFLIKHHKHSKQITYISYIISSPPIL